MFVSSSYEAEIIIRELCEGLGSRRSSMNVNSSFFALGAGFKKMVLGLACKMYREDLNLLKSWTCSEEAKG